MEDDAPVTMDRDSRDDEAGEEIGLKCMPKNSWSMKTTMRLFISRNKKRRIWSRHRWRKIFYWVIWRPLENVLVPNLPAPSAIRSDTFFLFYKFYDFLWSTPSGSKPHLQGSTFDHGKKRGCAQIHSVWRSSFQIWTSVSKQMYHFLCNCCLRGSDGSYGEV